MGIKRGMEMCKNLEGIKKELSKYYGKSLTEIGEQLSQDIKSKSKNSKNQIIKELILKSNYISVSELELLNIELRTMTLDKNGNFKEHLSLPPFEFKEIYNTTKWEDSSLKQYLENKIFLIVIFTMDEENETRLDYCLSLKIPQRDIDGPIREVWLDTKEKIAKGPKLKYVEYNSVGRVTNDFIKSTEKKIIHIRPHSAKSSYQANRDASQLPEKANWENKPKEYSEYYMTKQSFWINKEYIKYNFLYKKYKRNRMYSQPSQLLTTYISDSNFGILDSKIEYSDSFSCEIEQKKIFVNFKENLTKACNLYSKQINNLNVLIGKNGAGKSSVLQSVFSPTRILKSHLDFINIYYLVGNIFWVSSNGYKKNKQTGFREGYYELNENNILQFLGERLDVYNKIEIFKLPSLEPEPESEGTTAIKVSNLSSRKIEYFLKFIPELRKIDSRIELKNNRLRISIEAFEPREYDKLKKIYGTSNQTATIKKMYKNDKTHSFILHYLEKIILMLLENDSEIERKFSDTEYKNQILKFDKSITLEKRLSFLENFLKFFSSSSIISEYEKAKNIIKNKILDEEIEIFQNLNKRDLIEYQIIININEKTDRLPSIADLLHTNNILTYKVENLSDGQQKFMETLSFVYGCIQEASSLEVPTVVLLDEPDNHLHPEWSRNFVNYLIKISDLSKTKIQIIIATHSPFIISDIPKNHVYTFKEKHGIMNANKSFGLSIGNLLTDENGFYMDFSVGEFARLYINELIENKDLSGLEIVDDEFLVDLLIKGIKNDN